MRDRLDAVGGTLEVASLERAGTTVTAVVPRTEAMRGHEALSFAHQVV
jgi:signal transduction histidine kinase